jgi:uncharacterized protein YegL
MYDTPINSSEQVPFGGAEFAENPEPRCPCILLLDTSGSMQGKPIQELNNGLVTFKDELMADPLAAKRVEICIITFGPVQLVTEFQSAEHFYPPVLEANGDTPIGSAIETALQLLKQRKDEYRSNGISMFRPWVFLITDGGPTDSWQNAARLLKEGQEQKSFAFFSVGVEGARMDVLSQISPSKPLNLKGLRFRDLFTWLSRSMKSVSRSMPGTDVPLENPTTPDGWASV